MVKLQMQLICIIVFIIACVPLISTNDFEVYRAPRIDQSNPLACPPVFERNNFSFLHIDNCIDAKNIHVTEDVVIKGDLFVCGSIVNSLIEQLVSCCEQLSDRIDGIEQRIDLIEPLIDGIQGDLLLTELRLEDLESCCDTITTQLVTVQSDIAALELCCSTVQQNIDDLQLNDLLFEIRIEELESCCDSLTARILALESLVENLVQFN